MESFDKSSPIWKRPPFEHQITVAKFHYSRPASMDNSDVGAGKTGGMIAWMQAAFNEGSVRRALIICPLTILSNWINELNKNSTLKPIALHGPKAKRIELLEKSKEADVFLINFEGLRIMFPQLQAANFDAVIVDEIHHGKAHSGSAKTPTQAFLMRELGKGKKFRRGMTGTLLTNDITDLWSVCQFIDPNIFKTNFWGFRSRYQYNANANKPWMSWPDWKPRAGAVEEIQKLIEPYAIRYAKKDILSFLPPVLFQRRNVELSDEQRKAYNELKKHFIAELEGSEEPLVALQILGRVNKLLQICSGFAYREGDKPYHFKSNAKLAELKEVLEEIGDQRVIIWTAFKEEVEIIKNSLDTMDFGVITGDTKQGLRQEIVDMFNAGSLRYLIAHPACAGEGLTILAPYALYYSRGWRLGDRIQSLGRNDRPGAEQFENLTVIDLVANNTMDEEVMAALAEKKDLLDTINPRSFKEMMK